MSKKKKQRCIVISRSNNDDDDDGSAADDAPKGDWKCEQARKPTPITPTTATARRENNPWIEYYQVDKLPSSRIYRSTIWQVSNLVEWDVIWVGKLSHLSVVNLLDVFDGAWNIFLYLYRIFATCYFLFFKDIFVFANCSSSAGIELGSIE